MKFFTALCAGLLFGAGLLLSGMTDPANVLGFLDFFGAWRPQLALVMAAAVCVTAPAFLYVRRRGQNARGEPVALPDRQRIDAPLILGATLFGIGWGLSGICPGPGIVLLSTGSSIAFVFMGAVIAGMVLLALLRLSRLDR
jgi:uncharacterized membrane protein YedE/YeeE